MKYWGRGLLLYLTITVLLYGTHEIWTERSYSQTVGDTTPVQVLATGRDITTAVAVTGGGTPGRR